MMGQTTKIQWTDATWNPWTGCRKVSEGCARCYMYRDQARWGRDGNVIKPTSRMDEPLRWAKSGKLATGSKIFTCSWSDFFIEEADQWRPKAWEVIRQTPQYTYQILTKRPERIEQCLPEDWGRGYKNVWLGVSVETNDTLHRIRTLTEVTALTRFVSIEPLLEMLTSIPAIDDFIKTMDWIIVGGESGHATGKYAARECRIAWIADIVWQAKHYGIPIFVKQMGTVIAKKQNFKDRTGADMREWWLELQRRDFPGEQMWTI